MSVLRGLTVTAGMSPQPISRHTDFVLTLSTSATLGTLHSFST
jgi:hypothetical protein